MLPKIADMDLNERNDHLSEKKNFQIEAFVLISTNDENLV